MTDFCQILTHTHRARQDKFGSSTKKLDVSPTDTQPLQEQRSPTDHTHTSPPTLPVVCRVQVRLPNGQTLRQTFPPSATLNDVATFVSTSTPQLSSVRLVQPFPHHEFTVDESGQSLLSLGLCPSASLVVSKHSKQEVGGASVSMDTCTSVPLIQHQSGPLSSKSSHGVRNVQFEDKLKLVERYRVQRGGMSGRGHVLGGGDLQSEVDRTTGEEQMIVGGEYEGTNEDMEIGAVDQSESHSNNSDPHSSDDEDSDENVRPLPVPQPLPNMGPPQPFGRMPPNFPMGRGRGIFGPPPIPGGMFGGGDDDMFSGTGHRLGGKETPSMVGELLRREERVQEAG